jgi:anti-sigma regulatory factor (Ser/Thr protein kinase)
LAYNLKMINSQEKEKQLLYKKYRELVIQRNSITNFQAEFKIQLIEELANAISHAKRDYFKRSA